MSRIWVKGGRRLQGEVTVQGSKNAVLPILSAAVLNPGITELEGVPDIADVRVGIEILRSLGAEIEWQGHRLSIDGRGIRPEPVPEELGERMRSSVLFLGPLLARFGEASVCRPGGCAIGKRPVDLHLEGLRQLGAKFDLSEERIHGRAAELKTVQIRLRLPSVGATQQLVMAACGVTGMVTLSGCAREPEVEALCCFLEAVGVAQIRGAGTSRIRILGGGCCRPTRFFIPGDRIAAGTYLAAAAGTGGTLTVQGISPWQLKRTLQLFRRMGCRIQTGEDFIRISGRAREAVPYLATAPYPGFPTDMQSAFLTLAAAAEGKSVLEETIFESRLSLAEELNRMGAGILVCGRRAEIPGGARLHGASVRGSDLRSTSALALAALMAEGESWVEGWEHAERGYESFTEILSELGGMIRKETEKEENSKVLKNETEEPKVLL